MSSDFSVSHIKKSYGRHEVLRDISFDASYGECIGIFGENGCGKSTLLSILAGAQPAQAGSVSLAGTNLIQNPKLFAEKIAYVPQENPLIESLSVRDNLSLWYPDKKALNEALQTGLPASFGLTELAKRPVRELSGGMKKRLSLACAMAGDAKILILDEPTAALDLLCKADIREFLRSFTGKGGLALLSTHEGSDLSLGSRAFLLEDGILKELPVPVAEDTLIARMREHHA